MPSDAREAVEVALAEISHRAEHPSGMAIPFKRVCSTPIVTLAATAVVAVTLVLAAVPANAYKITGNRWPGPTITYHNTIPLYDRAVRRAAAAWNRVGLGIRFAPAPLKSAMVKIAAPRRTGPPPRGTTRCLGLSGFTTHGYIGRTQVLVQLRPDCRGESSRALLAAHELGHVLGLGHERRRCALMNTSLFYVRGDAGVPVRCSRSSASIRRWARKLLGRDDLRGARALYRRPPPVQSDFAWDLVDPELPNQLQFHAFLVPARNRPQYVWDFGDPASGAANRSTSPAPEHTFTQPGTYTVALRVSDRFGKLPARRRQVTITSAPAPPPPEPAPAAADGPTPIALGLG